MFLMFPPSGRPDGLPVRRFRNPAKAFGLHFRKRGGLPPPEGSREARERPGRRTATVASWYLWRSPRRLALNFLG